MFEHGNLHYINISWFFATALPDQVFLLLTTQLFISQIYFIFIGLQKTIKIHPPFFYKWPPASYWILIGRWIFDDSLATKINLRNRD